MLLAVLAWCTGCVALFLWGGQVSLSFVTLYLLFSLPLARMIYPSLLGSFLTNVLYYTALNKFPLDFGPLSLTPWIKHGVFHLLIQVESVCFGNPPLFPHKYFLEAYGVSLELSVSMQFWHDLLRLMPKTKWSPFPSACVKNTNNGTDPVETVGTVCIEHLEISQLSLRFEMHNSECNINSFTRILAEGESFKPAFLQRHQLPRPNCLEVTVLRAKGLSAHHRLHKADAKVVITLREQQVTTQTIMNQSSPTWNEHFELHLTDPSAVLHVECYDEHLVGKTIIGQWVMTTKYLLSNPLYNWHMDGTAIEEDGSVVGWFPLSNAAWDNPEEVVCGSLKLRLRWTYKQGFEASYRPPCLTCLEQLQQGSKENGLRLGSLHAVKVMLSNFPLRARLRRLTVRNVECLVRDLFMGVKGAAEKTGEKKPVSIRVVECDDQQRWLRCGPDGLSIYHLCLGLAMSLPPQLIKYRTLYSALSSILGGVVHMSLPQETEKRLRHFGEGKHTRRIQRHWEQCIGQMQNSPGSSASQPGSLKGTPSKKTEASSSPSSSESSDEGEGQEEEPWTQKFCRLWPQWDPSKAKEGATVSEKTGKGSGLPRSVATGSERSFNSLV